MGSTAGSQPRLWRDVRCPQLFILRKESIRAGSQRFHALSKYREPSQKPHLSRGVTDGPSGNSKPPERVCHQPTDLLLFKTKMRFFHTFKPRRCGHPKIQRHLKGRATRGIASAPARNTTVVGRLRAHREEYMTPPWTWDGSSESATYISERY